MAMNFGIRRWLIVLWAATAFVGTARAQVHIEPDATGDAVIRRADLGADGIVDEAVHAIPDVAGYQIGPWLPNDSYVDPYVGTWAANGDFLRIEITFQGFVNPPGPLALSSGTYAPYLYGPNPVFGFVEFDVDNSVDTGGEVDFPAFRYTGNAARFGGKPSAPTLADRVATQGDDLDNILSTPPFVERSGEEWHLALFGDHITQIIEVTGNGNGIFEPQEVWLARGRLLHRAHAFEPFSGAGGDGVYKPMVDVRFEYAANLNLTLVTVVFPLTNAAAATQLGEAVQPLDGQDTNQASIQEGLADLVDSVTAIPPGNPLRNDPRFALLSGWEYLVPDDYLNPSTWDLNLLAGMAYVQEDPSGALLAWTDVLFDPVAGDFNGDGIVQSADVAALDLYLTDHDGVTGWDADATVNGIVQLINFGPNFSLFDLNCDGQVGPADRNLIVIMGDLDMDLDVDLADLVVLVDTLLQPGSVSPEAFGALLARADFNEDGLINGADIGGFIASLLAANGSGASEPLGDLVTQPYGGSGGG